MIMIQSKMFVRFKTLGYSAGDDVDNGSRRVGAGAAVTVEELLPRLGSVEPVKFWMFGTAAVALEAGVLGVSLRGALGNSSRSDCNTCAEKKYEVSLKHECNSESDEKFQNRGRGIERINTMAKLLSTPPRNRNIRTYPRQER